MPFTDVLLAIFVMFLWGLNWVLIKVGLHSFPPFLFCALRFSVSAFPWIFLVGFERGHWKVMAGFTFVLGITHFAMMFWAVQLGMPAGLSSLVYQVQVFITALMALVLFGDKISKRSWIGMFISFSGIALIGSQVNAAFGKSALWGFLCILCAALLFAINSIMVRKYKPQNMTRHLVNIFAYATLPMFLLSWIFEGADTIRHAILNLNVTGGFVLIYSGILSTIVAFSIWGYLLKKHPSDKVVPFAFLVPVFGLVLAAWMLDEKLSPVKIFASFLIILGLLISNLKWRKKKVNAVVPG